MSPRFIADPPQPISWPSRGRHFRHLVACFGWIVWQIVTPFKSRPEEIEGFPDSAAKVTEPQLKQCQWIFDQAAARRVHLEQKAQSTFGLMLFLVPLLASLFVFVTSKSPSSHATVRLVTLLLAGISAIFLFLGFIAASRAIGVKALETLFLNSVIDDTGQFRDYTEAFHARGLLYCAAMNEGLNDHIAQFVKGAHVLTAAAVIAIILAAVPASYVFSGLPASQAETRIAGPVNISSPELTTIHDDLLKLNAEVSNMVSNGQSTASDLKRLDVEFGKLETKVNKMQKSAGDRPR